MSWTQIAKSVTVFTNYAKRVLSFLQKEDNTYLLLEDGTSKIVLDYGSEVPWTKQTKN